MTRSCRSVMVTATDIIASSGVIHVIDTVLLPPGDDEESVDEGFTVAPVPGGIVLTVYTGSLEGLVQAGEEMDLHTAAATVGSGWVMHVFDAPAFVSADFDSQFADGFDGTPLAIRAY